MIPAKIITREEAVKLGLTEERKETGIGFVAAGTVVEGKYGKKGQHLKGTIMEKHELMPDGKNKLIYMHQRRKKEIENRGILADYLNQFQIINGIDKETYFKKHKLKPQNKIFK